MVKVNSIDVLAPAKTNLHLAVGPKRDDNFHDLQSIFARISLFDEIHIDIYESDKREIILKGLESIKLSSEDTMTKAARLWSDKTNTYDKIVISIKKNIPSEAGLGGGSSDGASVLLALQKLYPQKAISFKELEAIGSQIGSDVPFFLHESTFAFVKGRGEFVSPIDMDLDVNYRIHLVKPVKGVSTKSAFSLLDKIERPSFINESELLAIFKKGVSAWKRHFFNDFEKVIKNDVLGRIKNASNFLLMSGSGSTCFEILDVFDKPSLISSSDEFDYITTFY